MTFTPPSTISSLYEIVTASQGKKVIIKMCPLYPIPVINLKKKKKIVQGCRLYKVNEIQFILIAWTSSECMHDRSNEWDPLSVFQEPEQTALDMKWLTFLIIILK